MVKVHFPFIFAQAAIDGRSGTAQEATMSKEIIAPLPAKIPAMGSGHIGALDLARAVAAVAVALFHFTTNGWLPLEHWLAQAGWYGHLGVRTFFVISGFVVPLAMWRGGYSGQAFLPFMARRMVRLYPPYLASVGLMAFSAWWIGASPSIGALTAHLLYLNDFLGLPWLIDVYWTLAVEVQFYLVLALLWPCVVSRRMGPLLVVAGLGAAYFLPMQGRHLLHYSGYFLLGLAAFRWHAALGSQVLNAGVAILSAVVVWRMDGIPAAVAAVLPLVLLALPMRRTPAWGKFLGDISYSFYLFHLAAGATLLSLLQHVQMAPAARVALVGVALAVSIGAAWLGYRLVEIPAMAWARHFTYRRDPRKISGEGSFARIACLPATPPVSSVDCDHVFRS
jgi:peptidoglycan/LPS O-acetylase OafA/YrhL